LKFILDENVPRSIYKYLKSRGFDVDYVSGGIKNSEVARLAKESNAVLITRDWDFSNTTLYPPEEHHGIIILRIHPPLPEDLKNTLENVLKRIKKLEAKTIIAYKDKIQIIE